MDGSTHYLYVPMGVGACQVIKYPLETTANLQATSKFIPYKVWLKTAEGNHLPAIQSYLKMSYRGITANLGYKLLKDSGGAMLMRCAHQYTSEHESLHKYDRIAGALAGLGNCVLFAGPSKAVTQIRLGEEPTFRSLLHHIKCGQTSLGSYFNPMKNASATIFSKGALWWGGYGVTSQALKGYESDGQSKAACGAASGVFASLFSYAPDRMRVEQSITGETFTQLAVRLWKAGGATSFYKGFSRSMLGTAVVGAVINTITSV